MVTVSFTIASLTRVEGSVTDKMGQFVDSFGFAVRARCPGHRAWFAAWLLVVTIAAFMFVRDLAVTRFDGDLSIAGAAQWGRDFVNIYTAGNLVLADRMDILYDIPAYQAYQLDLFDSALTDHNYSYPPVTLLYAWAFALSPYPVALIAWLAGTGAFFLRAARPYLAQAGLPMWMALLVPASLVNVWAGHYGFLIGGLWLAAWKIIPDRPIAAGILIGMMVIKPHMALLAPIVLLRRRAWPTIAAAGVTVALLVGLSMLLFGMEPWRVYLTETTRTQVAMVDDTHAFFIRMMPTVSPALSLMGSSAAAASAGQAAVGVTALALLLWRMPADSGDAGLATATATFLVLPYAFCYDMTAVGIASLIIFQRNLSGTPWSIGLAALAFVGPTTMLLFNAAWPVTPIFLAYQLLALTGFYRTRSDAQSPSVSRASASAM